MCISLVDVRLYIWDIVFSRTFSPAGIPLNRFGGGGLYAALFVFMLVISNKTEPQLLHVHPVLNAIGLVNVHVIDVHLG